MLIKTNTTEVGLALISLLHHLKYRPREKKIKLHERRETSFCGQNDPTSKKAVLKSFF